MIHEELSTVEGRIRELKDMADNALMLVDKVKRLLRIMEEIDNIYVNKILTDPTWQANFNALLTPEEQERAKYLFETIHKILEQVRGL